MDSRLPRWQQIGHKKSTNNQKSIISHSSRYTPRKSDKQSQQENVGFRQIALNMNQGSIISNGDNKTKSSYNYVPQELRSQRGQSQIQSKIMITESSMLNSRSVPKKRAFSLKRQVSDVGKLPDPMLDGNQNVENQFKKYMKYIDQIETKFQSQKIKIETMLLNKQEQIKDIKNKIIQAFTKKKHQINDSELRKMIQSRLIQKQKGQSNIKLLSKVVSEKKLLGRRQNILVKDEQKQNSAAKRGESIGSQKSWGSCKFDKIFNTLNQMKTNLNDCKRLRQVNVVKVAPSPKKRISNQNKGNLVNINPLKIKSKKTIQ